MTFSISGSIAIVVKSIAVALACPGKSQSARRTAMLEYTNPRNSISIGSLSALLTDIIDSNTIFCSANMLFLI